MNRQDLQLRALKARYGFFGVDDSVLCDDVEQMQLRIHERQKEYSAACQQLQSESSALAKSLWWHRLLHQHFDTHMASADKRLPDEIAMDGWVEDKALFTDVGALIWSEDGFRLRPGAEMDRPSCLLLAIGGLDSYREVEPRIIAEEIARHSDLGPCKVVVCDYPGQGGFHNGGGLNQDWTSFLYKLQGIIDAHGARQNFIVGVSLGGTLALRAAAGLSGLTGALALGPVVSGRHLQHLRPASLQRLHRAIYGPVEESDGGRMLRQIDAWFEAFKAYRPHPHSFIVNGELDHLVGPGEYRAQPFASMAVCRIPGAEHVATTRFHYVLPALGDLLAGRDHSFHQLAELAGDARPAATETKNDASPLQTAAGEAVADVESAS